MPSERSDGRLRFAEMVHTINFRGALRYVLIAMAILTVFILIGAVLTA